MWRGRPRPRLPTAADIKCQHSGPSHEHTNHHPSQSNNPACPARRKQHRDHRQPGAQRLQSSRDVLEPTPPAPIPRPNSIPSGTITSGANRNINSIAPTRAIPTRASTAIPAQTTAPAVAQTRAQESYRLPSPPTMLPALLQCSFHRPPHLGAQPVGREFDPSGQRPQNRNPKHRHKHNQRHQVKSVEPRFSRRISRS